MSESVLPLVSSPRRSVRRAASSRPQERTAPVGDDVIANQQHVIDIHVRASFNTALG
ncbi:hypothetical protein [Limobrevibacterium gyesilva]|uniref:Uncharacterized protein n=1 Tax=Limobrevibacterium gyesilva TaxID=2991712 RepID=A0AA41YSN4_9PROT|nr:hypothetical protein [Limobrevibacterium gyesilva]MCW3475853.1 hypothetical protein [Limobrevibacterium gyesilva]